MRRALVGLIAGALVAGAAGDRAAAGEPVAPDAVAEAGAPYVSVEPSRLQLLAARRWAARRRGRVSFAVADASGAVRGRRAGAAHPSASLSKAMILVACLRARPRSRVADAGRLAAMIRSSDNGAASALFRRIGGDAGLVRVARAAGMRSFGPRGFWAEAQLTAGDQARFFAVIDRLVPPRHRRYARGLLSGIVPAQSWGVPRAARPRGWKVFFKGGWRGRLVHQAALLERGGRRLSIAVLTEGNPTQRYGQETVQGVAARLLPAGDPLGTVQPGPEAGGLAGGRLQPSIAWRMTGRLAAAASSSRRTGVV